MLTNRRGTGYNDFARFRQPQAAPGAQTYTPSSADVGFGGGWGGEGETDFGGGAIGTGGDFGGGGDMASIGGFPGVMHYAQGGAIDEATGDVNPMGGMGGNFGAQLTAATKAVQAALMHGRRRYGIMGDDEQKEAGLQRMPATPGTQSESGKREQPMPGPLPPTSNPFGKRAEADEEAIPTDDDGDEEMA